MLIEEEYPNLHFALGPLEFNAASRQQEVSLKQMRIQGGSGGTGKMGETLGKTPLIGHRQQERFTGDRKGYTDIVKENWEKKQTSPVPRAG